MASYKGILGLYWGCIGVIWGLYGGYMGIMENKMEATIVYWVYTGVLNPAL